MYAHREMYANCMYIKKAATNLASQLLDFQRGPTRA